MAMGFALGVWVKERDGIDGIAFYMGKFYTLVPKSYGAVDRLYEYGFIHTQRK
jgi:hypothetical protein